MPGESRTVHPAEGWTLAGLWAVGVAHPLLARLHDDPALARALLPAAADLALVLGATLVAPALLLAWTATWLGRGCGLSPAVVTPVARLFVLTLGVTAALERAGAPLPWIPPGVLGAALLAGWLGRLPVLARRLPSVGLVAWGTVALLHGTRLWPAAPDGDGPPAVVVLAVDGWPLEASLDADGSLDATRLPRLAGLAAAGRWFRGARSGARRPGSGWQALLGGLPETVDPPLVPLPPRGRGSLGDWLSPDPDPDPAADAAADAGPSPPSATRLDDTDELLARLPDLAPGQLVVLRSGWFDGPLDGAARSTWLDDPDMRPGAASDVTPALRMLARRLQHADAELGRVLDGLSASGHADDVLLVLCGTRAQDPRGYAPPSAAVPLVARGPGVGAGSVTDHALSPADVLPALLAGRRGPGGLTPARPSAPAARPAPWPALLALGPPAAGGADPARLGTPAPASASTPPTVDAYVVQADELAALDADATRLPLRLTGLLQGALGAPAPPTLSVSLGGRVVALARPTRTVSNWHPFEAWIPAQTLRDGDNDLVIGWWDLDGRHQRARLVPWAWLPRGPGLPVLVAGPGGSTAAFGADRLRGRVDGGQRDADGLHLSGWAARVGDDRPADRVLAFAGQRLVGEAPTGGWRPGLPERQGRSTLARAGFALDGLAWPAPTWRLVAVSGDAAGPIGFGPGLRALLPEGETP